MWLHGTDVKLRVRQEMIVNANHLGLYGGSKVETIYHLTPLGADEQAFPIILASLNVYTCRVRQDNRPLIPNQGFSVELTVMIIDTGRSQGSGRCEKER
jgi:hypothetical protein